MNLRLRKQAVGIAALTSFSGLGMGSGRNRLWTSQGCPPRFRQTKAKEVFLSFDEPFQQAFDLGIKVVYADNNTVNVRMDLCFCDIFLGHLFPRSVQQDLQPLDFTKGVTQDRPKQGQASGKKHTPEVFGYHYQGTPVAVTGFCCK
jgi:hypothetical protein